MGIPEAHATELKVDMFEPLSVKASGKTILGNRLSNSHSKSSDLKKRSHIFQMPHTNPSPIKSSHDMPRFVVLQGFHVLGAFEGTRVRAIFLAHAGLHLQHELDVTVIEQSCTRVRDS